MPLATIVILVKNGERYLDEVLSAIFAQVCNFSYEVVLIDSGSKDSSLSIANRYPVRVISISPDAFNHGETRNLGAREADSTSEYIVYLTQDATPHGENWLQSLILPLREDPLVAGVFSRHIPRGDASISTIRQLVRLTQTGSSIRLVKQMPSSQEEFLENRIYYVWFSNTSAAIRREVWREHPFGCVEFAEDALWADEVLQAGYKTVYEPSSVVVHSHDYSLIEQFRQNVDHQYAMYRLFQPKYLRDLRNWLKLYLGIPLQTWRDYKFAIDSDHFKEIGLGQKIKDLIRSPFWYFSTISGGLIGSYLDEFPRFLSIKVSRQERIKRS